MMGVVCCLGTAVMVGLGFGLSAPLGRPVALTLGPPLNLPLGWGGKWLAGEGTVVAWEEEVVVGTRRIPGGVGENRTN